MKNKVEYTSQELLEYMESVSGDIQLLALNIAVAAAKLSHKKNLNVEINQKLSQLVNQATQAVKHMNQILSAAKTEKKPKNIFSDPQESTVDQDLIHNIETALGGIIKDSEKIVRLLTDVKKG